MLFLQTSYFCCIFGETNYNMQEIIELIVKVKINYPDKSRRNEAIKLAKECAISRSVLSSVGCKPKSAKLRAGY